MKIALWPKEIVDNESLYMDTYLLDTETPCGAVIVCPGGGYSHLAEHEGRPIAEVFNSLGFHAFVLRYRICPTHFPEPQQDVLRGIKIVRMHANEWKINSDQIAVCGFSSGGHAAASSGVFFNKVDANIGDAADSFSARPDAMVLGYPVINVQPEFGHVGSGKQLAGENISPEMQKELSLETQVSADTPPAFLWHTATDAVVPMKNSLVFAQALWDSGVKAELHVFPEGRHGLGLALNNPDIQSWPKLVAAFLKTTCGFDSIKEKESV